MGCVSSHLLDRDEDFSQFGGSSLVGHHIVSLTSTTYGLLTMDPPPNPTNPPTPPRFNLYSDSIPRSEPEIINSWELMAGLDTESSRFSPSPGSKPSSSLLHTVAELDSRLSRPPKPKENQNPNNPKPNSAEFCRTDQLRVLKQLNCNALNSTELRQTDPLKVLKQVNCLAPRRSVVKYRLEDFEKRSPPNGENKVVLYTTTLRGVRKTFEACNAVRSALEGLGVAVNERDVSMHKGYREELRNLLSGSLVGDGAVVPPRVFIKGRYIGGAEEVLRVHEEGCLNELVDGMTRVKFGAVCEGCGGCRFLPCFDCNGSCKIVMAGKGDEGRTAVIRCSECNENGLVLCPICS